MDLRDLQTFVAVATQGTVSKAALQLHIAQPALSRRIGDLERELGVRLFDRIRRRLVLTGEGERLLSECQSIVTAVDALTERAELLRRPDAGVLKVAVTPQMIDGVFSNFLHHYAAKFPNVEIQLTEAVGMEPFARLDAGEVHLVISYQQLVEIESHWLETFPLPPIEFLAAGHESFVFKPGQVAEVAHLARYPLLLLDKSYAGMRGTFDAVCRLAGVKPRVYIESRSPHTLLAMAEAGHGIAIVPSVLPTHRYRLRIARVAYRRRPLRGLLAVFWDRRRVLPPYAKEFCKVLDGYMRQVFPISRPTGSRRIGKPRAIAQAGTGRRL
jgi:DNA-binding transcriptional LysR family regulator